MKLVTGILFLTLILAAFLGWVLNIVDIVHMINDPTVTPMLVVRIVGVFVAPLGAVLGFV